MTQKLLVVCAVLLLVGVFVPAMAGSNIIMWEDHFEDDEDVKALNNVGWVYYPDSDIQGAVVEQANSALFMEVGSYGGIAGVVVALSNGLPMIVQDEDGNIDSATVALSLQDKWSDPNQEVTFKVNFERMTTSFFAVGARMPIDSSRGDANPEDSPAYSLYISPLEGVVRIGSYTEELQGLQPATWTYYGEGAFPFELGVDYWVKYYLNEGSYKAKIWEGELGDEPDEWLIDAVDPEPRVTGNFTMFAMFGNPPDPGQGDRVYVDDVVVRRVGVVPVTLMLDMSIQEEAGKFDPETDKVVVRGAFNDWAGDDDELKWDDDEGLYTITLGLDESLVGTAFEYKFVISPDGWEDNNRSFTLEEGGMMLDPVFFNDEEVLPVTANITFQGDLSEMLANGWFDPTQDQMRVTGGFNGWGDLEDHTLEADLLDPSLYVKTISHTGPAGADIGWKFRGRPDDRFLDNGWEGGDGQSFTFTGTDVVLDKIKPNILPAGSPLSQAVTVRFSVDINDAVDFYNKKPFPTIDGVYLNGDFAPLGAGGWAGWTVADTAGSLIPMYDDGATGGDEVAGDKVYTVEVPFDAESPSIHLYKYGIYSATFTDTLNGGVTPMDNEAGFAANHPILISDTAPLFVNEKDFFGSQWNENVGVKRMASATPMDYVVHQNYPNPFNPTTEISYAIPRDGKVKLTVFNSLGQRIATLVDMKQMSGSYQVTWNGMSDFGVKMSSGVYFYHIEADGFSKTMKMIMMK
jgi:hypothetical protein